MRQRSDLRGWGLAWLTMASVIVGAVPTSADADEAGDRQAIRAAGKAYIEANQRGDFETLLKMWTPDGDYVDASGQVVKARELIRRHAAAATTTSGAKPTEIVIPESVVRFITQDVAIEDGIIDRGVGADGSLLTGRFTAVWVKRDGSWQLDGLREGTAASSPFNEHLTALDWILGEWVGTIDGAVILVSSQWSDGGKFIVREFVIQRDGHEAISGTQRLGWDPIAGRIKSWGFDSQGGSGEGHWRREGDRWLAESTDVSADGRKSTTSAVYLPNGDGQFTWEVTSTWDTNDAHGSGDKLPALSVEFRRAEED